MAEFVEYRMECALPEYEQMRVLNLFTNEEILKMKKARENFEYRITQPSRVIKDFVEYIKYERSIVGLTKQRTKIQKPSESHTICTLIAKRMKQLYDQGLSKFPHNIRFWDEYVKFLHQFKFTKDISSTFDRMLQFHSDKAEVWIRAILWEYNENYSDERVKGLLLRAQQLHPESRKLYLTFFQIELENKRQADENLALQHATIVYTNGKKKFNNVNYCIEMLNVVDQFSYAISIRDQILYDMREMFPHEDIMWHTLAQRELNGLPTVQSNESVDGGDDENKLDLKNVKIEDSTSAQQTLRKRIESCVQIYEEAVKMVNTSKMWNFYLNSMIELNEDLTTLPSLKRYALSGAFEGANQSNQMTEKHYLQYIELMYSNNPKDENIEQVFQKATKIYKTSEPIWLQYVRYYIRENNFKKLKEIFESAKVQLGANGSDIWYLYLMYLRTLQTTEANKECEHLIMEVAAQPHSTFNTMKAQILEHIAASINIKRARKTYNTFIKYFPSCYEVHEMMAELQAKQLKRDVELERRCLEMMILNFGKVRTDVWLRYMRFERNVGDPKNVSRLHQNALATLNPNLLDDFSAQYNFFSSGTV